MCIYSPMPHTLSYCALIGKCALIRSNTVITDGEKITLLYTTFTYISLQCQNYLQILVLCAETNSFIILFTSAMHKIVYSHSFFTNCFDILIIIIILICFG